MAGSAKTIAKPVLIEEPGATASPTLDGSDLHVGIVSTRHCQEVVDALAMACRGELLLKGVGRSHIHELQVMQPYDIPYAVKRMLQSAPIQLDAVVVVGCLVRGESVAFDFVAEAVTRACMKIGMKTKTPVIYGVLTCTDEQQARHCAGLHETSKTRSCGFGVEWAQSAIDMGHMNRKATKKMVELCGCQCHPTSSSSSCCTEASSHEKKQVGQGSIAPAFTTEGYTVTKEGHAKKPPCGQCGHEEVGEQESMGSSASQQSHRGGTHASGHPCP